MTRIDRRKFRALAHAVKQAEHKHQIATQRHMAAREALTATSMTVDRTRDELRAYCEHCAGTRIARIG